jgi:phosphoserine phosphatase
MDGVLTTGVSSWVRVHEHFGVSNEAALELFVNGEIDDLEFIRRDVALWMKGGRVHLDDVARILHEVPLMPGAVETVQALHEIGIETAIVSGGLEPMAQDVARRLGIKRVYSNGLHADTDGYLTGEGILRTPLVDKGLPVRELLEREGLEPGRVASVGDSCPDIAMFELTGLGVAFNPADPCVQEAADHVVAERDLRRLLPHVLAATQGNR